MRDETMVDLWKKLQLITDQMSRIRTLAAEDKWEEAQELLRRQEQACRQFARLVERQFRGSVEPDELTQQFCRTLKELKELIDELQQSFGQRREELLESLLQLNEQDRVTKQYQGLKQEKSSAARSGGHYYRTKSTTGSRPNGHSKVWSPRRLALYS